MECGGLTFRRVATPAAFIPPATTGGPIRATVDKHHLLGFEAGRELVSMELEGRHYIEVVGSREQDDAIVLPDGASLGVVTLAEPFVVLLPEPTTAFFWMQAGMRSFQGPVELP